MGAFFAAINANLVCLDDTDWLQRRAAQASRRSESSEYAKAILALAASNVDPKALMQVIREKQVEAIWSIVAVLHDRCGISSEHTEHLRYAIAFENTANRPDGDYERRIDRMNLLPDGLHSEIRRFIG